MASTHRYFAVIDASHGGTERGAALGDTLAEKDVNLAFARQLQHELQARGAATLVLRDSDANLTVDQRASLANSAHPAIYVAIHSTAQGHGARLFTALLPVAGDPKGRFQPWETAQAPFLQTSLAAAQGIALDLRSHDISANIAAAPLGPLNHIVAPAIAIEICPGSYGLADLTSATYQQALAASIASGLMNMRTQLEAGR